MPRAREGERAKEKSSASQGRRGGGSRRRSLSRVSRCESSVEVSVKPLEQATNALWAFSETLGHPRRDVRRRARSGEERAKQFFAVAESIAPYDTDVVELLDVHSADVVTYPISDLLAGKAKKCGEQEKRGYVEARHEVELPPYSIEEERLTNFDYKDSVLVRAVRPQEKDRKSDQHVFLPEGIRSGANTYYGLCAVLAGAVNPFAYVLLPSGEWECVKVDGERHSLASPSRIDLSRWFWACYKRASAAKPGKEKGKSSAKAGALLADLLLSSEGSASEEEVSPKKRARKEK